MTPSDPITSQVDRLIANLLAGDRAVHIPGIGTLLVERQAARRLPGRKLLPPHRSVEFRSDRQGSPLDALIVGALRRANPSASDDACRRRAAEILDRWMESACNREQHTLAIAGVGTLRDKSFDMEEAFARRLNPQGCTPVPLPVRRRFDWVMATGIAAIVAAIGFAGYYLGSGDSTPQPHAALRPRQTSMPQQATPVVRTEADSETPAPAPAADTTERSTQSAAELPARTAEPLKTAPAPADRMISGRSYVVAGVYSTPENARRAAEELAARHSIRTEIYRFGEKWMLSAHDGDATSCSLYLREHRESIPGLWTYTAR